MYLGKIHNFIDCEQFEPAITMVGRPGPLELNSRYHQHGFLTFPIAFFSGALVQKPGQPGLMGVFVVTRVPCLASKSLPSTYYHVASCLLTGTGQASV